LMHSKIPRSSRNMRRSDGQRTFPYSHKFQGRWFLQFPSVCGHHMSRASIGVGQGERRVVGDVSAERWLRRAVTRQAKATRWRINRESQISHEYTPMNRRKGPSADWDFSRRQLQAC
jgi:hypothetical protein